jgi:hypothetical protein
MIIWLTHPICGKVYYNILWEHELKLWNFEEDFCNRNSPCMYVRVSKYKQLLKCTN